MEYVDMYFTVKRRTVEQLIPGENVMFLRENWAKWSSRMSMVSTSTTFGRREPRLDGPSTGATVMEVK